MGAESVGVIVDLVGVLIAALPWLAKIWWGRRDVLHGLRPVDGRDDQREYVLWALRGTTLGPQTNVTVHLTQPHLDGLDVNEGGLHLVSAAGTSKLVIKEGSHLEPEGDYRTTLTFDADHAGDARLLPLDPQAGISLVRIEDWTRRHRTVRWVSGPACAALAAGSVLSNLGWFPFPTPDPVVSGIAVAAAVLAGIPGLLATRALERAAPWTDPPPVSA